MSAILITVIVVAAGAVGITFYKYKTASAVAAAAKTEITHLESFAKNVDAKVKVDYAATVKRIKALF